MKKPLISIVTPVYNSYHLMDNLINSLEKQSCDDFEIIFINDLSTDNSYELLSKRLENVQFSYTFLSNERNLGPGETRNCGISNSSGDYITFIDSDDYVSEDFIKKIKEKIKISYPDAIIFDYYINNNQKSVYKKSLPLEEKIIDKMDALALCNGMCWGKVLKKKIVVDNNVKFPKLMRSEDLAFVKVAISFCESIVYFNEPLYYYNLVETSIMHTRKTLNILNNIKAFEYIEDNVTSNEALEMVFIRDYLYIIVQNMIILREKNNTIKDFIISAEKKYPEWYKNKYLKYQPLYLRLLLRLIKHKNIFLLKLIFKLKK